MNSFALDPSCPLCSRIGNHANDPGFLLYRDGCYLFKGPYWDKWPGSVVAICDRHVEEQSDLPPVILKQTQAFLLDTEHALRVALAPKRMNVVKFGNVCAHLHWHIIPRYLQEKFPDKSPWELQEKSPEEIYPSAAVRLHHTENASTERLRDAILTARAHRRPPFFACALIFRPNQKCDVAAWQTLSCHEIRERIQRAPDQWECLLMQRNYLDFSWDHFGGQAEIGEKPIATLARELYEEAGIEVAEALDVTRQWNNGLPTGFVYIVKPKDPQQATEVAALRLTEEVKDARFFAVSEILESGAFRTKIKNRLRALVANSPDCEMDDSQTGK